MSKNQALGFLAILVIIAAAAGTSWHYLYEVPRNNVKKSTRELAPLANKTLEIDNDFIDSIEESEIKIISELDLDESSYRDKYVEIIDTVVHELDSAKTKHEEVLDDLNKTDSCQETKKLRQDLIDINKFYIKAIPDERRALICGKELVTAYDTYMRELDDVEIYEDSSVGEYINALNIIKKATETLRSSVASPELPDNLDKHRKELLAIIEADIDNTNRIIKALKAEDFDNAEKLAQNSNPINEQFKTFAKNELFTGQFNVSFKSLCEDELKKVRKTKDDFEAIKSKYGEKWVSKDFDFTFDFRAEATFEI